MKSHSSNGMHSGTQESVLAQLRQVFGELAGQDLQETDPSAAFIELGFDSLFLTQAATALRNRFGVKVTFRQLNEDLASIAALADYIAGQSGISNAVTPGSNVIEAVPVSKPLEAESGNASSSSSLMDRPADMFREQPASRPLTSTVLERVMNEQLRVMEMQLALLRGSTPTRPGAALAVSRPVISAAPPGASAKTIETAPTAPASTPAPQHGPFRPLDKGAKGGLTPGQQAHLDWLIPLYVAKTSQSKEYTRQHRPHLADPRAVAGFKQNWKEMVYPIVSTRSSGAYIWDLDGNRWVDVTLGFGVALLGHSPAFITEAVKKQLDLGVEIGPQSPLAGEVAKLICEFTGMDRVTFCNTGSEAVMAALRVCRTVTGRTRVALFAGAYHGTFDEVLVKGVGSGANMRTMPIAPGVAPNLVQEVTVLEYGTAESLEWIRAHSSELAAVLVESVQSRHPDLQPVEFLREVRKITRATETPLIFDEVITGFRCHPGGAQALFEIEADLGTYGKIIGGGMPFGFIAGKAWLMDAFDGGQWEYGDESFPAVGVTFFAGTFVRHPLAMAAARAMLLHLKEQGPALQAELAEQTKRLIDRLNDYFKEHGIPMRLERFASVWYPHFDADVKYGSLLYYHLREKGLHIWEGRPCFLSTAHTTEDELFIENAFKASVAEMQHGGFLTGTSDAQYVAAVEARKSGAASPRSAVTHLNGNATPRPNAAPARDDERPATARAEIPTDRFPLTDAQMEMWLAAQIRPEASAANNASTTTHLWGELDSDALERAIREVVQRHEALRSTFSSRGTEIVVLPKIEVKLPVDDLRTLPADERDARRDAILRAESGRVFDLEKGPLFAFRLIRLASDEHLLVFTVQMIVCDGWSYNIVLEEIGAVYSALVRGQQPALSTPVPMREYVHWQDRQKDSPEARDCEEFWLNQFKTLPPPVDLPGFKARPRTRTFNAARESLRIPTDVYESIKRVARDLKNTPFALLLTTYEIWLHRLTNHEDLVIGVPFAGQTGSGLEALVGQCVHTLPLRARITPAESFDSLLRKTRSALFDAQEHWNYSLGKLIQRLDLPNDPSRVPLVSVLFNFDPPMSRVQFADCARRIESAPRTAFSNDLGFNLVDEGNSLLVECDYNTNLLDAETVRVWLAHYQTLIQQIIVDPNRPIHSLEMLSVEERKRLLTVPTATEQSLSAGTTLIDLVAARSARAPESIAAEFEGQTITRSELERRSNQLANHLRSLGVHNETIVGICLDRSLDIFVALLGILKSGAAFVPIDPDWPGERMATVLTASGASVLITQASRLPDLPRTPAHLLCMDEDWNTVAKENTTPPACEINGDHLAYVMHTSGSTGIPQMVEIAHRSLVNFLESMRREPGLEASDTMLAVSNLTFDIAYLELFLPLITGARVVIAPRATTLEPKALSGLIEDHGVTVMQATPATWRMLLDAGWRGKRNLKVLCGGEALAPDLAESLIASCAEVWNMYGPTETTIWSTVGRVQNGKRITLGHPIANTQVYVVDDLLRLAPTGAPGEILIGGLGLARGYRNSPASTAAKFIPDPFSNKPGARVFRTGDIARYNHAGEIEFIGRRDFQVKIRGYRIEIGEIETILRTHPRVCEAVVVAQKQTSNQTELVAYLTVNRSAENGSDEAPLLPDLRTLLRKQLPAYMIPSAFVVLDRMPRTSNGKIDRRALPAPGQQAVEVPGHHVPAKTPTEAALVRIWSSTLKLNRIGIRDNFFEIGGQSLLAASMFARIEKELGKRLPLAALFRAPTIEQLARELDGKHDSESAWASLVPINPMGSNAAHPPLFLVHGAGGNVLLYRALARSLGAEYPLYGLQAQGLDGTSKPLGSIEEMAMRYLKEIRMVQPAGPYFIGGYCMGGTVAYEMAQILVAEGDEVGLLALLDTYEWTQMKTPGTVQALFQKVKFHARNMRQMRLSQWPTYLSEKIQIARDGEWTALLRGLFTTVLHRKPVSDSMETSVHDTNDRVSTLYRPKPYRGRVTVFKPRVNYDFYPDPLMGWGGLALGGVEVVELPINPHAMLVEPYVCDLARELKTRLDSGPLSPAPEARPVEPLQTQERHMAGA